MKKTEIELTSETMADGSIRLRATFPPNRVHCGDAKRCHEKLGFKKGEPLYLDKTKLDAYMHSTADMGPVTGCLESQSGVSAAEWTKLIEAESNVVAMADAEKRAREEADRRKAEAETAEVEA